MHIELTRQSVVIKCNLEASIMTGNYEMYYAAGLIAQLTNREIAADIQPEALHDLVHGWLDSFVPANGQEKHLVHMLRRQNWQIFLDGNIIIQIRSATMTR